MIVVETLGLAPKFVETYGGRRKITHKLKWNFHGITYCIFEVGEGPSDITQNKGTSINVHYLRQKYDAIKIKTNKLKRIHFYIVDQIITRQTTFKVYHSPASRYSKVEIIGITSL